MEDGEALLEAALGSRTVIEHLTFVIEEIPDCINELLGSKGHNLLIAEDSAHSLLRPEVSIVAESAETH